MKYESGAPRSLTFFLFWFWWQLPELLRHQILLEYPSVITALFLLTWSEDNHSCCFFLNNQDFSNQLFQMFLQRELKAREDEHHVSEGITWIKVSSNEYQRLFSWMISESILSASKLTAQKWSASLAPGYVTLIYFTHNIYTYSKFCFLILIIEKVILIF